MITYEVFQAVEHTTPTGKVLKKLTLQKPGAQYPTKNVTIWNDNPLYAQAVPGAQLTCDLMETDSGTPNPNAPGKNYINRTVADPNRPAPTPMATPAPGVQTPNITEMAIKTHVTQELGPIKEALREIIKHLGIEAPQPTVGNTGVPYPTPADAGIDPSKSMETPVVAGADVNMSDQINPEDIPF